MDAVAAKPQGGQVFGVVFLKGRIEAVRRHEGRVYTRLLQPAADAYSRPAINEIVSKASLGSVGDEVQARCRVGGFARKPYQFTDQQTGEVRRVVPVDNTLEVVE